MLLRKTMTIIMEQVKLFTKKKKGSVKWLQSIKWNKYVYLILELSFFLKNVKAMFDIFLYAENEEMESHSLSWCIQRNI